MNSTVVGERPVSGLTTRSFRSAVWGSAFGAWVSGTYVLAHEASARGWGLIDRDILWRVAPWQWWLEKLAAWTNAPWILVTGLLMVTAILAGAIGGIVLSLAAQGLRIDPKQRAADAFAWAWRAVLAAWRLSLVPVLLLLISAGVFAESHGDAYSWLAVTLAGLLLPLLSVSRASLQRAPVEFRIRPGWPGWGNSPGPRRTGG